MTSVRLTAEERKSQIVEETVLLVGRYGVQGTSTRLIAAAAGVSEATLYKHFASRNEMLLAALDLIFDRIFDIISSSEEADAITRLREIALFELDQLTADGEKLALPLFEFIAAPPDAGLREHMARRQLEAVRAHVDIIEEGKAQGMIRPDINSEAVAWRFVSVYWMRDVAYLMGIGDEVYDHSTGLFEAILGQISVQPACT